MNKTFVLLNIYYFCESAITFVQIFMLVYVDD